ncbi:MAG: hypothetical protein QOF70_2581 [Acetobacteraceae bacterium]|jgi:hypothetical protein|nr:hypothetical protein [Acetobacteraceae bacterium]
MGIIPPTEKEGAQGSEPRQRQGEQRATGDSGLLAATRQLSTLAFC